jgi:hypothetical protein
MDVRAVPLSLVRRTSSLVKYRKSQVAHLSDECVDLLACVIPSPNVDRLTLVMQAINIMHAINVVSYMEAARFCGVAKIMVIFEAPGWIRL